MRNVALPCIGISSLNRQPVANLETNPSRQAIRRGDTCRAARRSLGLDMSIMFGAPVSRSLAISLIRSQGRLQRFSRPLTVALPGKLLCRHMLLVLAIEIRWLFRCLLLPSHAAHHCEPPAASKAGRTYVPQVAFLERDHSMVKG